MIVDLDFERFFSGRLRQVFLYITDRCNLSCGHCLYKTTLAERELPFERISLLLSLFFEYGARKVTLLGGEPTLYDGGYGREGLAQVVRRAAHEGYTYVRIDTNGQYDESYLDALCVNTVSNLSFSLDGPTPTTNDELRGANSFRNCVQNIKNAVDKGYYVSITSCVHRGNAASVDQLIALSMSLGVRELNFHPLVKAGIARDEFSGTWSIEPTEWEAVYSRLKEAASSLRDALSIRVPQRFVAENSYLADPCRFEFCPVRLGERILVHPDGDIRVCALCIGSKYRLARVEGERITMESLASETDGKRLSQQPCMTQSLRRDGYVNLCMSYKPGQKEFVWTETQMERVLFG